MRNSERFSEQPKKPRRPRDREFWRRIAVGVIAATAAIGGVLDINTRLEKTNTEEATEVADHVFELTNTGTNDDRGIDSQTELDALRAKLGDTVDLRVVPRLEHTGVVLAGDSVKPDAASPMTEIEWREFTEPKFILLGNVHYEGPMSAARLIAVGPDGKEFFKEIETGKAVDMVNPIFEPTTEGLVFYGSDSGGMVRVTISYDGLLRTVTHEGQGVDQAQANLYNLTINGQALSESRYEFDPSKKGEHVIAELQAKADEYIMAIIGTNETLGSGIRPMDRAIGEMDLLVRAAQLKIGELPNGDPVVSNSPRAISFPK